MNGLLRPSAFDVHVETVRRIGKRKIWKVALGVPTTDIAIPSRAA